MNNAALGETKAARSDQSGDKAITIANISPTAPPAQALLSIALDYAARGFAVFPCLERSKAPAIGRGFYSATTNPATIRRWFLNCPQFNLAIATGLVSSVWVLDIDGSNGAQSLLELEAQFGPLPATLTSITSTGCHLWFCADRSVPSTAGRIGAGLDTRGCGGYVLAPPSVHPDGPVYRWGNERDIAIAPEWLMQRACRKPPAVPAAPVLNSTIRRPVASPGAYGRAALERECQALACEARGGRNHALNRASFRLHRLVAGGELNAAEVVDGLVAAATANGLVEDKGLRAAEATIASGARAGLQHPRSRPAHA
jgi:hypothetical protein